MRLACVHCHRDLDDARGRPSFCPFCGHPVSPPDDSDATTTADPEATVAAADAVPLDAPARVGPYRLLRRIGAGGMGTVYEAEEDGGGRRVALKLIARRYGASPDAVERFRREGRLAGLIAHPRCVFLLAADEDAGRPYLVMELMPGDTLHDLVRQRGPLPTEEAVSLALDVIAGLQEVHRLGIVHRDIKPSNCFLDREGRAKVGDFGLARSLEADARLTRTGSFVGTPLFASPEQLKGEAVDPRGDVYAVAATLYFLLTGRAPHEGSDPAAVAARIASEPPPPPRAFRPDLPPRLERVLLRGLERQPERRFRDLESLRRALLPFAPAGELSIGGMGRRLIAVLIDALIVLAPLAGFRWLAEEGLARSVGQQAARTFFSQNDFLIGCILTGLVALHFGLLEGVWGCSAGKRLLRLRVYRSSRDEPAGLWRPLLRAVAFCVLLRLPEALFLLPLDCGTILVLYMILWLQFPKAIFVICTMRRRNGYRGLHEFLSGTRTVQLPWPGKRPRPNPRFSTEEVPCPTDTLSCPAGLPTRLGPFPVHGAVGPGAPVAFLFGEDPALGRDVLLWVRPAGAAPLPVGRRDVARPTRLRWLTGGVEGDLRWDAFTAPAGRPVTDLVAAVGPFTWEEVRPLLGRLAEELSAACAGETLPDLLTLDQALVRPDGDLELLDAPLKAATGAASPRPGAKPDERALVLLREFATLTLEGKSRPPPAAAEPIRRPLPLHAPAALAGLFGADPPEGTVADCQRRLAAVADRPARVTRAARALQLVVQGMLLLAGFMAVLIVGSLLHVRWISLPLAPLVLIGASLAWAFLLRGGPSFPMAGLALVRSDGRRAARWQAALRSALVWAQWLIPSTAYTVTSWWLAGRPAGKSPLDFQRENDMQWCLIALIVWALLTAWLPRRTLHDRLAGTYIVPE
jgi:hypothetical protein